MKNSTIITIEISLINQKLYNGFFLTQVLNVFGFFQYLAV